jgi:hypothetical protein
MGAVSVTRCLRFLVTALLLAGWAVVAGGEPGAVAAAPRCPNSDATIQSQTMDADDVFTGKVTGRTVDGNRVAYAVTVDRVFKGDVDSTDVTVTTAKSSRACGLPDLAKDSAYVFFTDGADLTTSRTAGTARATDARVARVERLLGDGRAPTPPEPTTATFTRVAGEPASLQRVAAPGLALVIVGVLGLGLAVGLGRRRG